MAMITGTAGHDLLEGTPEDDSLVGAEGNDTLFGGEGADTLDGGAGFDSLVGGPGNDTYLVNSRYTVVSEEADSGRDRVITSATFTLPENVEDLYMVMVGPHSGTGNSLANFIRGANGNNSIDGAAGNDTLVGGAGDDRLHGGSGDDLMVGGSGFDRYYVDTPGDRVREAANEGHDTIHSPFSYRLGRNVEGLWLEGSAAIDGTGNSLNNTLIGNSAANVLRGGGGSDQLEGGGGADLLYGGVGDDLYIVDSPLAVVKEFADAGIDRVWSRVDYRLPANVENLQMIGNAAKGIGNALPNTISANFLGDSLIDGKGGADTLIGGNRSDTFVYDPADALVDGKSGIDKLLIIGEGVVVDLTAVAPGVIANIEVINLKGSGDNTLVVAAQDVLDLAPAGKTLTVLGNAGDTVDAHGAWVEQGAGTWYYSYSLGDAVLRIDADITVNIIA